MLSLTVTDMSGKILKAKYDQGTVQLHETVQTGTYFVKVVTVEGTAFAKIIVQ
jgi:hypothetical protein